MIIVLVILLSVLGAISLYIFQDKLIFSPQKVSQERLDRIKNLGGKVEEINIQMKDGSRINGWFVKNSEESRQKTLIYFGGNAEELSYMVNDENKFGYWSLVLINYRGYGLSEGTPSELNLYSDALEIYDYFSSRSDIDASKMIVMGRSLGAGIATYVAYNRNPKAVILVSPSDSLASEAKETYPAFIIDSFLKYKFDSLSLASSIKAPALILIASNDTLVPPWHSIRLAENWGEKVIIQEVQDANHNSIIKKGQYWDHVAGFLKSFE